MINLHKIVNEPTELELASGWWLRKYMGWPDYTKDQIKYWMEALPLEGARIVLETWQQNKAPRTYYYD